jgi:Na+:H+ antiporter, NhaC family
VIAMSIGSSRTTAGTIGVGLVKVAVMLGVSPAITAGAVISGAYLGDMLSPLSETTVLTAQMVEVDVHQHIKRQAWTLVPAFLIALVVFLVIGLLRGPEVHDLVATTVELTELNGIYRITPVERFGDRGDRPAAVTGRHGQHAAHAVADRRRGDLRGVA